MSDWHALSHEHGPQRAAYQRADPAPAAPTLCARCGKALKPPAIVVTRTEALCPTCGGQVPDDRPDPPLYCGRRIEDLVMQAQGLYDKLGWRLHGAGSAPDDAPVYGVWGRFGADGRLKPRPRTTWGQLRRARLAAYRRYWRRKRLWLTQ